MNLINLFRGHDATKVRARFGMVPKSAALQLLPASATGQQWLDARRGVLGASDLPTVLGLPGAYGSPFALWWGKKSGWDLAETEEMAMGRALEPVIADVWAKRNRDAMLLRPGAALYGHPAEPWLVCTPDYLAVVACRSCGGTGAVDIGDGMRDRTGPCEFGCGQLDGPPPVWAEPVECKAYDGGPGWGEPGTDEVPDHIACQVQVQCAVLGAPRGHVARLRGKKVTLYTITARPLAAHWLTFGAAFVRSLAGDQPPPIDGTPATEAALTRLYADIDPDTVVLLSLDDMLEYRLAMAAVRDAKARKQKIVNRLRDRLGTAEFGEAGGERFVQRRVGKRAGYTVAPSVVDALYPVGRGEA